METLASLEERVSVLENKLSKTHDNKVTKDDEQDIGEQKVVADLLNHRIYCFRMIRVPSFYYDKDLAYRASLLKAHTSQLCKSIIFENSWFDPNLANGDFDRSYSRYYLVILQYEGLIMIFFFCFRFLLFKGVIMHIGFIIHLFCFIFMFSSQIRRRIIAQSYS